MARYLGIEVTEAQVKGVVLRTAYRKLQIDMVHRVPRRAPGPEGLTVAVQELLNDLGPGIDAVYAAMPGLDASFRILELPKAVVRRGGRVIATELEGTLPFDIEAAVVDAQVIRPTEPLELFAAAARTERVRTFIDALKAGGADPREIGVGPIALGDLASVIPELAVPGPILLLHAYETFADFTILADGVVHMARTLSGQTTPAARERGIRQTLGAYLSGGGTAPIAAYLVGEAAYHNMDVVADALGLPAQEVRLGLPLGTIQLSPAIEPSYVQIMPLALAMALRGMGGRTRINLRRGELAMSGGTQVLREKAWLLTAALAAIVMSWGVATYMRYVSVKQERDRLVTALERVTLDVFGQRVSDPERAKALALGTNTDAEQDPIPSVDAYDVIGVLSARIPDSVRHDINALDVTDEHVQIQGLVDTLADRDRVVEALSQYECFQNIEAGRAQRNAGDNRQLYTLDLELRCPDRTPTTRHGAGAHGAHGASSGSSGSSSSSSGGNSGVAL